MKKLIEDARAFLSGELSEATHAVYIGYDDPKDRNGRANLRINVNAKNPEHAKSRALKRITQFPHPISGYKNASVKRVLTMKKPITEAKEYGSTQWGHEVISAAKNKGIKFTHTHTPKDNTHHVETSDAHNEAKLHDHLKSWFTYKGKSKDHHHFNNEHTNHADKVKVLQKHTSAGAEQGKKNAASAEHEDWKEGHKFDIMTHRYRK